LFCDDASKRIDCRLTSASLIRQIDIETEEAAWDRSTILRAYPSHLTRWCATTPASQGGHVIEPISIPRERHVARAAKKRNSAMLAASWITIPRAQFDLSRISFDFALWL
jgi:hypothetical protein